MCVRKQAAGQRVAFAEHRAGELGHVVHELGPVVTMPPFGRAFFLEDMHEELRDDDRIFAEQDLAPLVFGEVVRDKHEVRLHPIRVDEAVQLGQVEHDQLEAPFGEDGLGCLGVRFGMVSTGRAVGLTVVEMCMRTGVRGWVCVDRGVL